jgi:hypothetical protein
MAAEWLISAVLIAVLTTGFGHDDARGRRSGFS